MCQPMMAVMMAAMFRAMMSGLFLQKSGTSLPTSRSRYLDTQDAIKESINRSGMRAELNRALTGRV